MFNIAGSIASSGLVGIQRGMQQVERAAVTVAREVTPATDAPKNLNGALLDAKLGKLQVQASAKVVETTDAMIGSLFNEFA